MSFSKLPQNKQKSDGGFSSLKWEPAFIIFIHMLEPESGKTYVGCKENSINIKLGLGTF